MTEALDYTTWTWEQHVTKACELAAEADRLSENTILSEAARRTTDVQQIALRAEVHARLAELKRPAAETVLEPLAAKAGTAPASPAAPSTSTRRKPPRNEEA